MKQQIYNDMVILNKLAATVKPVYNDHLMG